MDIWQHLGYRTYGYRPSTSSILLPPVGSVKAAKFTHDVYQFQESLAQPKLLYHIFRLVTRQPCVGTLYTLKRLTTLSMEWCSRCCKPACLLSMCPSCSLNLLPLPLFRPHFLLLLICAVMQAFCSWAQCYELWQIQMPSWLRDNLTNKLSSCGISC